MPCRESPFLAWGDFHARSHFARSTIPEEKWGTTRSLQVKGRFDRAYKTTIQKVTGNLITRLIVSFCVVPDSPAQ